MNLNFVQVTTLLVKSFLNSFFVTPRPFRLWIEESVQILTHSFFYFFIAVPLVSLLLLQEMAYHLELVLKDPYFALGFTAVLLVREMVPVLVAMLVIGKVGASLASQLGAWVLTDEYDAEKVLGLKPEIYYWVPKAVAYFLTNVFYSFFCLWCSLFYQFIVFEKHRSLEGFFQGVFRFLVPVDFWLCLIKILLFSFFPIFFIFFFSTKVKGGASGLGKVTTKTLVFSMVFVIFSDLVVNLIFRLFIE